MEAYNIGFNEIGSWTLEQLYFAVANKDHLPQRRTPGKIYMSYEQAVTSGVIGGEQVQPISDEDRTARMRKAFADFRNRGNEPPAEIPEACPIEQPKRGRRRRGG